MYPTNINTRLASASHNPELFKNEYLKIVNAVPHKINALLSYSGGKYKMRKELNEIFNNYLTKNNSYDTYIDGFYGMGGSFKALSDSLERHGVKNIIVNEINPCIAQMHANIRNAPTKMINYFLETLRTKIVIPHNKLIISYDEIIHVKQNLINRFHYLQNKKEFGIETSTLFLMLSAFNFSGIVSFKRDGKITFSKNIYYYNDIEDFFFKTIIRIKTFSKLYNRFNMTIYNSDYFTLYREFKNRPNTLWNIDPVYLKEDYRPYNKDEMQNITNADIKECEINYSQANFKHLECLETLKDIDFIYNNNTSPVLYHYINKFNLQFKVFNRKEAISAKSNQNVKTVQETIIYQNNYKKAANNFIEKSSQKCA